MSDSRTTHLVGTYNISFAADAGHNPNTGFQWPSETTFGKGRLKHDIRVFYNNAIARVKTFLDEPDFSVIGLQEINDSRKGENQAKETMYGDKNLENMVETYNKKDPNKQLALCFDSELNIPKYPTEGIAIIWNETKLGHKKSHKLVNMFHNYDEGEDYKKTSKEDSRPMLMVLTSNNYLLVNCHGRNEPGASARTMKDTTHFISSEINTFLGENKEEEIIKKTFITGDFNDRFDGFNKITVDGIDLTYNGQAPRSCCYNRDSSCIENKFYNKKKIEEFIKNDKEIPSNILTQFKSILNKDSVSIEEINAFLSKPSFLDRPDVGLCDGDPNPPKSSMSFGNIKNGDTNAAGDIANYRYYGDKIFGYEPANEPTLTIYPDYNTERINAPSKESDHEMVIGTFFTKADPIYDYATAAASEGGRRRKRKTRRTRKTKRRTRKTKRKQRRVSLKKKRRTTKRK
jgi:hypothetical protein